MNSAIFKAYDVRGLYPADINKESVSRITEACSRLFAEGAVVIGHDGRHGSVELADTAKNILERSGKFTVLFIGLSTTPMFYFLVNHFKAEGGIMITASHNPKEYNGMKVVGKNAIPISGTDLENFIQTNTA